MKSRILTWIIATILLVIAYAAITTKPAYATFPGTNGRISFAREFQDTQSESIFSIRPDGTGELRLTSDAAGVFSEISDWSPNGSRIAFDSNRSNQSEVDVFTMKADGTDVVQLTSNNGFVNAQPSYSPDGATIVFERQTEVPQGIGIHLMNANDGTNIRRVTVAPAGYVDILPHFSPDGARIVFSRVRCIQHPSRNTVPTGCISAVYIVNIDGSGLVRITPWGQDNHATDWSPDGKKIALDGDFERERKGITNDVYIVNVDGSGLVNLTNNLPAFTGVPCSRAGLAKWSPDGTQLVFWHGECTGHPDLQIMNADGSNKHHLVDVKGFGFPDWGSNQE